MSRSRTRLAALTPLFAFALITAGSASPADAAPPAPVDVSDLLLPGGPVTSWVDSRLAAASGKVQVVVRLVDAPLAVAAGAEAKQKGSALSKAQQVGVVRKLAEKQNSLTSQVKALGGVEIARVSKALNAVVYEVDAARLTTIAGLPGVASLRPVVEYELDLSDTVPAIGATAVQKNGYDGTGVRVAVLDSGIDYTHEAFGGAGNLAAYQAAYGMGLTDAKNTTTDGLFPTAKVVGGYDFVGEAWGKNDAKLAPDPDPIDCGPGVTAGCAGGHGTHVADIIAGVKGVAPGASLLIAKVCSAVSSSCSGVALLQGMDFALDPNGDDDIADAVDVVNMSLGSSYGQREDDLSDASANAVRMGVTVVASAGNSADRPYITGSPASTPEVISVAQTQVPSAIAFPLVINSPADIAGTYGNTATVEWAPIGTGFTGDVAFAGLACAALPAASLTGKVALIDRGTCSVSLKTDAAAKAGAIGVLIANNAAGDAPSFSFGGGTSMVPTLVITQSYGTLIKAHIAAPVNVTVSPETSLSLKGSMVASSARGPSYSYNAIKPDLGAPGASVSAVSGSGTGTEAFGGTSGAAPMVSGAAALLVEKYGTARTPAQLKALLMNTGETQIYTNPATLPGALAAITRIGGGEVRVDRAAASQTAAWDTDTTIGSLSFGYQALTSSTALKKSVTVRNYGASAQTYTIAANFRYADDAASGAVRFQLPSSITVPANGTKTFTIMLKVDASKLPTWTLNGGARGGDGSLLQSVEFDGYLQITSGTESVHVPWHVLPHKAAAVAPSTTSLALTAGAGSLTLSNTGGAIPGRVDVFALTGQSPKVMKATLPQPGDNYAMIDLKSVGVRQAGSALQFAVNTFGERSHPNYPAEFDIYVDTNRDGTDDYAVYNGETGGFAVTGQNVVYVVNLKTNSGGAYYYADADLNSGNAILTVPMAALGLTSSTDTFDFSVYAFDNYFTGALTDQITNMTYTPGTPKFATSAASLTVPVGGSVSLGVTAVTGGAAASPSQSGLLLMYRDGKPKAEASAITVTAP